jgi:hypothetical protein
MKSASPCLEEHICRISIPSYEKKCDRGPKTDRVSRWQRAPKLRKLRVLVYRPIVVEFNTTAFRTISSDELTSHPPTKHLFIQSQVEEQSGRAIIGGLCKQTNTRTFLLGYDCINHLF